MSQHNNQHICNNPNNPHHHHHHHHQHQDQDEEDTSLYAGSSTSLQRGNEDEVSLISRGESFSSIAGFRAEHLPQTTQELLAGPNRNLLDYTTHPQHIQLQQHQPLQMDLQLSEKDSLDSHRTRMHSGMIPVITNPPTHGPHHHRNNMEYGSGSQTSMGSSDSQMYDTNPHPEYRHNHQ